MLRPSVRLMGFVALAAAMAAGVVDGARGIADGFLGMTSLESAIAWLLPRQFPAVGPAIASNIHPLLWDPLLVTLLRIPTVVAMFGLGAMLLVLGRPRQTAIAAPESSLQARRMPAP